MEKTNAIRKVDFVPGLFIELDCCMCGEKKTLGADSSYDLSQLIREEGWKELHSGEYQLIGYWCGCDYMDN